ncbi:adenosylhomocysteinase [Candidatus Heimdallarchaeota archaeon B3_Heim]|nr:MAG: adenosylhomocysteinase [Candidatus Heimdallarchaeota archaeon B3_Heim]
MGIQTEKGKNFEIKDASLAEAGRKTMDWAESRMPVLKLIKERFRKEKPLKGVRIGACLHVTKETSQLCDVWLAGGAEVYLCASNPLSTQDEIPAALVEKGVHVYAWKFMDTEGYYRSIGNVIAARPHITIDDGADLVSIIHKLKRGETDSEIEIIKQVTGDSEDFIEGVWGGAEETTTGIIRLESMAKEGALLYPIMATNSSPCKNLYDNVYGTGQSTIDGILRATADLIASKVFVVAGYGHCGKGVAMRAKGMGARRVIITEIEPHAALQAVMEGMEVMPMLEASKIADIIVTTTGNRDVLRKEHFKVMKNECLIANSGHFNVEINIPDLEDLSVKKIQIRPFVEQFVLPDNRRINLLGEGRLINLAAAEGHPSEIMDISFSLQALASEYITKNKDKMSISRGKVIEIPKDIDDNVAFLKCHALRVELDVLTPEQKKYLASWKTGT